MKFYTVHVNPARKDEDQRIVLVKEGFAWWAFFAPLAWALYRRVWLGVAAYAVIAVALFAVLAWSGFDAMTLSTVAGALLLGLPVTLVPAPFPGLALLALMAALLCGFEANDLRRFALKRRGYALADVVAGRNEAEAERAYFEMRPFPARKAQAAVPAAGLRRAGLGADNAPIGSIWHDPLSPSDGRHP